MTLSIPIVDIGPFTQPNEGSREELESGAKALYSAFSQFGFCFLKNHGVPLRVRHEIFKTANAFFDLLLEEKMKLHVRQGGVAWRGYMNRGGESTHGSTDLKEGIYFGPEHPDDHPKAGLPLHGKNQFPDDTLPEMRPVILDYIDRIQALGKSISDAISVSLSLDKSFMREHFLSPEPISIVRCFKYFSPNPESIADGKPLWGIGEHSDFGYLTILQTDTPGLQFQSPSNSNEWIDVPVVEDLLICNVGDMLDMLTSGRFKSTWHRVQPPPPGQDRISFPFFFDFAWDAKMVRLSLDHLPPLSAEEEEAAKDRWAKTTFTDVSGIWAQYLAKKVKKVFPDLDLPDFEHNAKPSTRFNVSVQV